MHAHLPRRAQQHDDDEGPLQGHDERAAQYAEEGEHAAMFNSSEEFEQKVLHYLRHEDERRRIVANARRFVLEHHLWRHRAIELVEMLHEALAAKLSKLPALAKSSAQQPAHTPCLPST